jgi:hypothetical protein
LFIGDLHFPHAWAETQCCWDPNWDGEISIDVFKSK